MPLLLNKDKLEHLANLGRLDEVEGINERIMKLAGIKYVAKKPEAPEKKPYLKHVDQTRISAPSKLL